MGYIIHDPVIPAILALIVGIFVGIGIMKVLANTVLIVRLQNRKIFLKKQIQKQKQLRAKLL